MLRVYPRAVEVKVVPISVNEASCVASIIESKEAGMSKAEAVGPALNGSDDVEGFNRLWDEIEGQVKAARAVKVDDFKDATEFKTEIAKVASHLDPIKWYDGLVAEQGVVKFDDLKVKKVEEL